jgi:tetratricopeptide (TPR) repeat protein
LKRFDEAIADLQHALELDPTYAAGYYNLGVLLANRGDLDEGLRAIERAASLGMPSAGEGAKWLRQEIEKRKSKRE